MILLRHLWRWFDHAGWRKPLLAAAKPSLVLHPAVLPYRRAGTRTARWHPWKTPWSLIRSCTGPVLLWRLHWTAPVLRCHSPVTKLPPAHPPAGLPWGEVSLACTAQSCSVLRACTAGPHTVLRACTARAPSVRCRTPEVRVHPSANWLSGWNAKTACTASAILLRAC